MPDKCAGKNILARWKRYSMRKKVTITILILIGVFVMALRIVKEFSSETNDVYDKRKERLVV